MGIVHRSRRNDINWLADGPIGPHVDAFKQYLTDRRYAAHTFVTYVSGIAHFAQWARGRRLRLHRIDEASVVEFLDQHLPHCRCVGPVRHDRDDHSAALGHLLAVLRLQGAIASPAVSMLPLDEELRCYGEYMGHVRGLAQKTQASGLRIVRRLLSERFGDGAIDIAAIKPEHVRRFFAQQAKLYSKPASAGTVIAALRAATSASALPSGTPFTA